ncbi:hypothetical protein C0583_02400 [Candidatus Parcubacteria bacterium]|nr:MAG: hypothetical protein C0583_02400 [Candidatus Parcubacteria bacterium]
MKKENFKIFTIVFFAVAITLGLSLSFQGLLAAWTSPTDAPVEGNVPAPINTGDDTQAKSGKFQAEGGLVIQKMTGSDLPAEVENGSMWLVQ